MYKDYVLVWKCEEHEGCVAVGWIFDEPNYERVVLALREMFPTSPECWLCTHDEVKELITNPTKGVALGVEPEIRPIDHFYLLETGVALTYTG